MQYKALICDVDGTLVQNRPDARPSNYLKESIKIARQKAHVGIATARPYLMVKEVMDEIELSSPCILSSGVQIFDPVTKKTLVEHILPSENLPFIYNAIEKLGVQCIVQERENRVAFSSSYQPKNPFYVYIPTFSEELAASFAETIAEIPDLILHKMVAREPGRSDYVITNKMATKQEAVLTVARTLGIDPSEIIGVGDGYNDVPLLMACGLKVAMGNAVDELKEMADYVAPTVDEDGVADVINRYLLYN
jgi:Cof subfamily protein (haloacid dehalogenase superfamily)